MRFRVSSRSAFAIGASGLLVAAVVATGFARSERRQNESIASTMTGGDPSRAPALIRR